MGVGWCRVDEDHVERQHPRVEQPRHIRQEHGNVVRATFVDGGACVRSDEQGPVPEVAGHLWGKVWSWPFAMQMDDTHASEFRRSRDKRIEQDRHGVAAAQWR